MRSVVVVFPASMWAMMPMLRIRSSGVVRAIAVLYAAKTRGDRDAHEWAGLAPPSSGGNLPPRCGPIVLLVLPFPTLPPVMRERPVGFRHPVRVFLLLDRLALALRREDQLRREPLRHVLLLAGAAVLNDPAHAERRAPLRPDFHRHLVRGAADAPRLH